MSKKFIIRTKCYGIHNKNARYDCPRCGEVRGRFYINVSGGLKHGKYICHNCGIRGIFSEGEMVDDVSYHNEVLYPGQSTDIEEPEESGKLEIVVRPDTSGEILNFCKKRGVSLPVAGLMARCYRYRRRMALRASIINDECKNLEFWNFRDVSGFMTPKVLFPSSKYTNIAPKSSSVLWNPRISSELEHRLNRRTVIPVIVEGDMAAWSIDHVQNGYWFVGVAVFGKDISGPQAKYFSQFSRVFYMPDCDVTGKERSRAINSLALAGVNPVYVYDRTQYNTSKDDANDILSRLGRNWFDPKKFQKRIL